MKPRIIFITGTSTSGKSTLAKEFTKLGYEAYDTEHNGMSAWFNKQTDKRVAEFNEMPERTPEWLSAHEWRIDADRVAKLAKKASNETIFLCGGSANEPEIRAMCDKVVWLKTDEATIRQRVNNPRDHDYGTKPHELAAALQANERKEAEYKAYGAIMVDARQPIVKVVDDILASAGVLPVITLHVPQYRIDIEPDYKVIGEIVDDELRKHFTGRTIVARGIGSSEHPGRTIDELVEIIKHDGTDRYDPSRTGDRYENTQGKHIDLFGFRRKVSLRMQLFKDVVYGFYHSALGIHGKAVRIDILIVYDATKLKAILHQYPGRTDKKRDGFVFRDSTNKQDALLGIIKILS